MLYFIKNWIWYTILACMAFSGLCFVVALICDFVAWDLTFPVICDTFGADWVVYRISFVLMAFVGLCFALDSWR
ncbi:hypothetical protein pSalSNUABM01_097 [Salmonella phage pSal-SNUABM-01]|nr:hypothetical protein pSalSNUABM01_097 [Salmonella phage pSal-SNUABM-01]